MEANEYPMMLAVLNSALCFATLIAIQAYMAALFLTVMCWISNLTKLGISAQPLDIFDHVKRCVELYNGVEKGMGPLFFLWISVGQISWIIMIFLAISMATDGFSDALDIGNFIFYLFGAFGTILQTVAVIFCLSDCHKSLELLAETLADDILDMEPGRKKQEAQLLLKVYLTNYDFLQIFQSRS